MLKRNILIIVCLLLTNLINVNQANAQVNFEKIEFNTALDKAQKENKYVFVDAYTGWCGYCVQLDTKTFRDSLLGLFLNKNFISIKMNMEEEKWGSQLAKKYVITSFPSGIIFNRNGRFIGIITGYSDAKTYLSKISEIINSEDTLGLTGYGKNNNVNYHKIYVDAMNKKGFQKLPKNTELNQLLRKQADKMSEKNWVLWKRFPTKLDSSNTNYFLNNINKFRMLYGKKDVNEIVESFVSCLVDSAISIKNIDLANEAAAMIDKYLLENRDIKMKCYLNYYRGVKDWNNYANILNDWINSRNPSKEVLNHYAMDLYYNVNDDKLMGYSIKWNEKAIQVDSSYKLLYAQALLYNKVKNFEMALKYIELSINIGVANDLNTSNAADLRKRIKQEFKN